MASKKMRAVRSVSGNQPVMRRLAEDDGETFLSGTPVAVNAAGYLAAWDGVTIAGGIAGIAKESGSDLAADGVPETLTFGSVPNQPNAVNIPRGAPLNDGRCAVELGAADSVFEGQVGPAQAALAADLGAQYGMTIDADGHWYVDKAKNNPGVNTVVRIVKLDTEFDARGVHFVFTSPQMVA